MDLIIFLFVFAVAFFAFIATVYFLAKWMFPVTRDVDGYSYYATDVKSDRAHPRISKNPYTFK